MTSDLWVFAYGSLMWRPDIPHVEARAARLHGYHRDFCVYSVVHRGTRARPGLVLGLAPGGSCRGIAYRVAATDAAAAVERLDARELVTSVYVPKTLPVRTVEGTVLSRCYVSDTRHAQFAGRLDVAAQAKQILGSQGESGCNVDYLMRTVAALEELGIHDHRLRAIAALCAAERPFA